MDALEHARTLAENGQYDEAEEISSLYLRLNPHDERWLHVMVYCYLGKQRPDIAYHLAKQATKYSPDQPGAWLNLGMAAADLWQIKEAERYYKRGLSLPATDRQRSMLCVNIASILIDSGRFDEAEPYCAEAKALNPSSKKAVANLGFAQLAQRQWKPGWENYRACIGSEWRPIIQFNDEPLWDGESKGTIVVNSEQGLGDIISFGSMLPDMIKWCDENDSKLIFETEARVKNLYQRTFPDLEVHGTRGQPADWDASDVTHSLPLGQLGEYFRLTDSAFPTGSYLVPDPHRVLQWKALFESKGKPVIGLAWRGGILKTGAKHRQMDLEQLLPILKSVDAHWVSLQYKPADKEIREFKKAHPEIDLVEYPWGTLTPDYDDTVALIAALDHVVTMQTAVVHVAGALGIPADVFVTRNSQWRYGIDCQDLPWAKSVTIHRQETLDDWTDPVNKVKDKLNAHFSGIPETAGTDARKDPDIRKDGSKVRRNGRADRRQPGDQLSA